MRTTRGCGCYHRIALRTVHVHVVCDAAQHDHAAGLATFARDPRARWQQVSTAPRVELTAMDAQGGRASRVMLAAPGARVALRCTRRCGQSLPVLAAKLVPVLERLAEAQYLDNTEPGEIAVTGRGVHIEITLRELHRLI